MAKGLDYSYAHPDLACVKRNRFTFVARYIGDPDPNGAKYLDAPELARIRSFNLDLVVVRETTAGFMFLDSGVTHARISRAHCDNLGLYGIPIYYALDVDPRGLSETQLRRVADFLAQAAWADGGGRNVGIYGSDDALDRFMGPNCHWGWQTYAWSGGRITPRAHFRQYLNGQSICGGTVDLNETYTPDFGQWPRPTATPPIPVPIGDLDMPFPVIAAPPSAELRPWTALLPGKIIRFANFEPLPEPTNTQIWVHGRFYEAGVRAGYLSPVREVPFVDDYDEACALAEQYSTIGEPYVHVP